MARFGTLYGPDITFLNIEKCDIDNELEMKSLDAVIIGAPYDGGTSYRSGTRFGPMAMRGTDYIPHDGTRPHLALGVDPFKDLKIKDAGDICTPPTDITKSLKAIEDDVYKIAKADTIPVVLGGDHSITYADVQAVAKAHDKKRIALVHFDAHPDTADTELGEQHGHGQWVRRLLETNLVKGSDFIQIGIRGYWPDNDVLRWMHNQGMRAYGMPEIEDRGVMPCINEIIEYVNSNCDGMFLSLDVDVCDPAFVPGTGTPEPGGFLSREVFAAVRKLSLECNVVGMDVVELCPAYDSADISALFANRVVLECLSGVAASKKTNPRNPVEPLLSNR